MNERDFWQLVKSNLERIPGLQYDRIESPISPGFPDIAYSFKNLNTNKPKHHGYIELKVFTKSRGHFTHVQKEWLKDHDILGGNVYIMFAEKLTKNSVFSLGVVKGVFSHSIPIKVNEFIPAECYHKKLVDVNEMTPEWLAEFL